MAGELHMALSATPSTSARCRILTGMLLPPCRMRRDNTNAKHRVQAWDRCFQSGLSELACTFGDGAVEREVPELPRRQSAGCEVLPRVRDPGRRTLPRVRRRERA